MTSSRRRNRWLRRLAVGVAFAAFASPAAARGDFEAPAPGATVEIPSAPARQGDARERAVGGWAPGTGDAIAIGVGTLGLALGLGLAVGYARRPRIAGL